MGKYIDEALRLRDISGEFTNITIGEVVDTNDPQQMGRLRVMCPVMGDSASDTVSNIPWATYVSPLGGTTTSPTRGRGNDVTAGQIAYGMFNIPKAGSSVLIACIDGDPRFRVWLGCLHDQFLTHTMPHGRYSYKPTNKPEGPFSSTEDKIQPLYDSQTEAFSGGAAEARMSHEFRTRGADVSVSGLGDEFVNIQESNISLMSDDIDEEYGDNPAGGKYKNTQGYQKSRVEDGEYSLTNGTIYDPQTYSWTTPGFHSMSMSDSAGNCRIRFRSTHGHQIIFDDTNERIYISTAGGKTWFELDEVGNIDIYAERNISMHAGKDINFTAGGTFRVHATGGIHMSTDGETTISAFTGIHLQSEDTVKVKGSTMFLEATGGAVDIKASTNFVADGGGGTASLLAGGNVLLTGAQVHFNGPPAPAAAGTVGIVDPLPPSRQPDHEPWARTMILGDGNPELDYEHPDVGRKENGEDLGRNPKWHR